MTRLSTIRCHYVPQFYLKNFLALGQSTFFVYDKKDGSVREQPTQTTCAINDYYVVENEGQKDATTEQIFSIMEGITKKTIDKIIATPTKSDERDYLIMAVFLSVLHCRVPRTIEVIKEMYEVQLEKVLVEMKTTAADPQKLRDYYEKYCVDTGNPTGATLDDIKDLMSNPTKGVTIEPNEKHAMGHSFSIIQDMLNHLMEMDWSICAIKDNHFFVTSDTPLNVFNFVNKKVALFHTGIGLPDANVAFPLSPKICMMMGRRPLRKFCYVDHRFVDQMNHRMIAAAQRFVISPYKSNHIKRIMAGFLHTYSQPKVDRGALKKAMAISDSLHEIDD